MRLTPVLVVLCLAVTAGCLAGGSDPVAADRPGDAGVCTRSGQQTVVRVEFESLFGLHVERAPAPLSIEYSAVTADPDINAAYQSLPPTWVWADDAGPVTVTIPVTVPADTPTGTYHLTLQATHDPPLHEGSPTAYRVPIHVNTCP